MLLVFLKEIDWSVFAKSVGLLLGIAIVLGGLILIVAKAFEVKQDTRISEIMEFLPKANCGGCGHPGCEGFAKALIEGKGGIDDCAQNTKSSKIEIANILGQSFSGGDETVAVISCCGGNKCEDKFTYQGYGNCVTQAMLGGGRKACEAGCMGTGACVDACPNMAVEVKEGVAEISGELCTSCGLCMLMCPKKIIKRVPKSAVVYVACSSQCKGKEVASICKTGCIACGICEKNCQFGAIHMENNVPIIDYAKCTHCMKCFEKCPRKVIKKIN